MEHADTDSRRRFLSMMGASGAAALGILAGACGGGDDEDGPSRATDEEADVAIVNYALTLEFLELELYRRAVDSGHFKGSELELMKTLGEHEQQHVDALTAAVGKLGGRPVQRPKPKFDLDSRLAILKTAYRLENLGAAAYLGQAPRIRDRDVLEAAIAIHSVEARHAATLNTLLDKDVTPTGAFARPASMRKVVPVVQLFVAR
jgi:rubrerythrin